MGSLDKPTLNVSEQYWRKVDKIRYFHINCCCSVAFWSSSDLDIARWLYAWKNENMMGDMMPNIDSSTDAVNKLVDHHCGTDVFYSTSLALVPTDLDFQQSYYVQLLLENRITSASNYVPCALFVMILCKVHCHLLYCIVTCFETYPSFFAWISTTGIVYILFGQDLERISASILGQRGDWGCFCYQVFTMLIVLASTYLLFSWQRWYLARGFMALVMPWALHFDPATEYMSYCPV